MKHFQIILSSIALIFAVQVSADELPTKVAIGFSKVYVPNGFDNNDNIQIVGEGMFLNSCFRNAGATVRVNSVKKIIRVGSEAYKYDGYCLQVLLPFESVVNIGILREGTYSIVQESDSAPLGQLVVRGARTTAPDDYMYAPISQAFFQSRGLSNKVFITGDFPVSCMKLKEVKFQVQPDVLVVQPIAEIDSSIPCVQGKYHFESTTDVGFMQSGRYLLHLRSMNGKAINDLVDVP